LIFSIINAIVLQVQISKIKRHDNENRDGNYDDDSNGDFSSFFFGFFKKIWLLLCAIL